MPLFSLLPASSIRGSSSSTPGSPPNPNTRTRFAALMFTIMATQDSHGGSGVELRSHLTLGLKSEIATSRLLSPPRKGEKRDFGMSLEGIRFLRNKKKRGRGNHMSYRKLGRTSSAQCVATWQSHGHSPILNATPPIPLSTTHV